MNAMRAIIWKDARQNLPWAGVVFWATAGALAYASSTVSPARNEYYQTVLGSTFSMATHFAFGAAGAVLGLLATVFESRGDAWAFLSHRPVDRSTIFWGKLLAAMILYALAAGLPLAGAIAWFLMPGHVAMPFYFDMSLSYIADFIAGGVCVPLGMIIGLRPARWYVSRGFPLAMMFFAMAVTMLALEFSHAVLLSILFAALAICAARGVFIAGISGQRATGVAGAALSVVVFSAVLSLTAMTCMFLASLLTTPTPYSYRAFDFFEDGKVVITEQGQTGQRYTVKLADDTPSPELERIIDQQEFWRRRPAMAQFLRAVKPFNGRPTPYWRRTDHFVPLEMQDSLAIWYYLLDEGRLAGYGAGASSKNYFGSIGPDGFAEAGKKTTDRFSGEFLRLGYYGNQERRLAFNNAIYELDLKTRSAKLIYNPPEGKTINALAHWPVERGTSRARLCVWLDDRIDCIDSDNTRIGTLVLPDALRKEAALTLVYTGPGVRCALAAWDRSGDQETLRVHEANLATGEVGEAKVYGPIAKWPNPPGMPSWTSFVMMAAAGPSLMGLGGIVNYYVHGKLILGIPNSELFAMLACLAGSSVFGLASCLWQARRWRLSHGATIAWALGGAAMGVLGVLVMRCVEETPVFERCAACGKKRLAKLDACQHCGAPAPAPVLDGSEVFAPLVAPVEV